ncbi:hypothetical protein KKF84_13270 [Myxococcota bacterium]|nr:hypothetical protein [Myxococcota bacterium]MBU1536289.1 hypothetical protein [Myxococcota bacterium]
MPSIEIVSIGALNVPELPKFDGFAYIAEPGVISHRGLFQDVLDKENGIIVHLANKEYEGDEEGGWFAGALMEWGENLSENDPVVFEQHRFQDVIVLLRRMIESSSRNEVIFLTDYQFGPKKRVINNKEISISEFIDFHQQRRLIYNSLYRIKETPSNKSKPPGAYDACDLRRYV